VFKRLRQRRETRRRGAEDANRLAKSSNKAEPPSARDPIEELSIIARIPPLRPATTSMRGSVRTKLPVDAPDLPHPIRPDQFRLLL
jgi:hypothetical protein